MANTSPRHMPVLGNVHPIKIENLDIFSWRHFSARSSFYIFNWYAYPRGFHEKYLREIVGPVFEIHAIESIGSMSTDETWRHLCTLHFYPEYIDLPGVCMQKFVMIQGQNIYSSGLSNIVNISMF